MKVNQLTLVSDQSKVVDLVNDNPVAFNGIVGAIDSLTQVTDEGVKRIVSAINGLSKITGNTAKTQEAISKVLAREEVRLEHVQIIEVAETHNTTSNLHLPKENVTTPSSESNPTSKPQSINIERALSSFKVDRSELYLRENNNNNTHETTERTNTNTVNHVDSKDSSTSTYTENNNAGGIKTEFNQLKSAINNQSERIEQVSSSDKEHTNTEGSTAIASKSESNASINATSTLGYSNALKSVTEAQSINEITSDISSQSNSDKSKVSHSVGTPKFSFDNTSRPPATEPDFNKPAAPTESSTQVKVKYTDTARAEVRTNKESTLDAKELEAVTQQLSTSATTSINELEKVNDSVSSVESATEKGLNNVATVISDLAHTTQKNSVTQAASNKSSQSNNPQISNQASNSSNNSSKKSKVSNQGNSTFNASEYYQDTAGKLRHMSGRFASKSESKAHKQNGSKKSTIAKIAKHVMANRDRYQNGSNMAGSAFNGSAFGILQELFYAGNSAKNMLQSRNMTNVEGIKSYVAGKRSKFSQKIGGTENSSSNATTSTFKSTANKLKTKLFSNPSQSIESSTNSPNATMSKVSANNHDVTHSDDSYALNEVIADANTINNKSSDITSIDQSDNANSSSTISQSKSQPNSAQTSQVNNITNTHSSNVRNEQASETVTNNEHSQVNQSDASQKSVNRTTANQIDSFQQSGNNSNVFDDVTNNDISKSTSNTNGATSYSAGNDVTNRSENSSNVIESFSNDSTSSTNTNSKSVISKNDTITSGTNSTLTQPSNTATVANEQSNATSNSASTSQVFANSTGALSGLDTASTQSINSSNFTANASHINSPSTVDALTNYDKSSPVLSKLDLAGSVEKYVKTKSIKQGSPLPAKAARPSVAHSSGVFVGSQSNVAGMSDKLAKEYHDAHMLKLDALVKAVEDIEVNAAGGGGGSLIDSAIDSAIEGRRSKKGRGRGGRGAGRGARIGSRLFGAGAMGAGALGAGGSTMAGGALAGAGKLASRAIPLLALASTAYDAYDGFTDTDKQRETFNLKSTEAPTLGHKSSMAAGSVLDLGGLTSGVAGLLGSGLGALGFEGAQEALTFNSSDIAKAIYSKGSNITDSASSTFDAVKSGDFKGAASNGLDLLKEIVPMFGMFSSEKDKETTSNKELTATDSKSTKQNSSDSTITNNSDSTSASNSNRKSIASTTENASDSKSIANTSNVGVIKANGIPVTMPVEQISTKESVTDISTLSNDKPRTDSITANPADKRNEPPIVISENAKQLALLREISNKLDINRKKDKPNNTSAGINSAPMNIPAQFSDPVMERLANE